MGRILTNKKFLPEPIVAALSNDKYVKRGDISVTTLIDSPKVSLLKKHFDYEEDVLDMTWALLGSAMHVILERSVEVLQANDKALNLEPRFTSEFQMSISVEGWTLTGTTDLLQRTPKIMWDYKNCSVWKIIKAKKGYCKYTGAVIYHADPKEHDSWVKQLNIYNWILSKNFGWKAESLRILTIAKDWKESERMQNDDYPEAPIAVIELPVYEDSMIESYVNERIRYHQYCHAIFASHGIDAVPPCTPEERWQRPETWKFYKHESAARATKNFEIIDEATFNQAVAYEQATAPVGFVKRVFPGQSVRCERYCPVNKYCSYFKNLKNG